MWMKHLKSQHQVVCSVSVTRVYSVQTIYIYIVCVLCRIFLGCHPFMKSFFFFLEDFIADFGFWNSSILPSLQISCHCVRPVASGERSSVFLAEQRIPYYPLESENPSSSSPNTHQICQSKSAALSYTGQLHWLQHSCQLYLLLVWRRH